MAGHHVPRNARVRAVIVPAGADASRARATAAIQDEQYE